MIFVAIFATRDDVNSDYCDDLCDDFCGDHRGNLRSDQDEIVAHDLRSEERDRGEGPKASRCIPMS